MLRNLISVLEQLKGAFVEKDTYFTFTTLGFIIILIVIGIDYWRSDDKSSVSLSPYQAHNLEALKTVKSNDLVLCEVGNNARAWAILVDQNADKFLAGSWIRYRELEAIPNGKSLASLAKEDCTVRILRPSETRVATDELARIILYGLNLKE